MNPIPLDEARTYFKLLRKSVASQREQTGVVLQFAFHWADIQVAALAAGATAVQLMPADGLRHAEAMCQWLNHLSGNNGYFSTQFDAGEYSIESDFTQSFPMLEAKLRRAPAQRKAAEVTQQLKAFFLLSFEEAARELPGAQQYAIETKRRRDLGPSNEDRLHAAERAHAILQLAGIETGRFAIERTPVGNLVQHSLVLDVRGYEPRMSFTQLQNLAVQLSAAIAYGLRSDSTFVVCFAPAAGSMEIDRIKNHAPVVGVSELRGVWTTGKLEQMNLVAKQLSAFGFAVAFGTATLGA